MIYKKYTDKQLEKAVKESHSVMGVMRILGFTYFSGGMHTHLSKRIERLGFDTSHFTGQGHNKGKQARNKLTPEEILVFDRLSGRREKRELLYRALISLGVPYRCSICGLLPEWNNKPITLPIDHINGNPLDNVKSNLRFLCPNCHSQLDNFSIRKK